MPTKKLPRSDQAGHKDDIISIAFSRIDNLIFTGAHDGSLLSWNFETGYIKAHLHENSADCMSANPALDGKSVESLVVIESKRILISGTADQWMRFWETTTGKLLYAINADHNKDD